jgi:hypothetical protein
VNDIDEALHFFCEVLGVEKRKDLIGTDRNAGPRRLGVDQPRAGAQEGLRVTVPPATVEICIIPDP